MSERSDREVVPAGDQGAPWYRHLLPIAKFLVEERGHMPIERPEKYGFVYRVGGVKCHLTRRITDDDWAAINERFVLPANIGFFQGLLRDNENRVDIVGHDTIIGDDGPIPIEEWEAQQRGAEQ